MTGSRLLRTMVAVLFSLLPGLGGPLVVLSDGLLPPQPYHYLHPPSSLTNGNNPPTSGETGIPLSGGHQTAPASFFTPDGQFGVDLDAGSFVAPPSINTIRLRLDPVETPRGLPGGLVSDGNAYLVTATELPPNLPISPKRTYGIVLRWPRLPHAVYLYDGHAWSLLCTAQQWEVSTSTVLCRTRALGTFLAVRQGTVAPQSNSSSLRRFLPLVLAALVVIVAAIAAFLATRSRSAQNNANVAEGVKPQNSNRRGK